MYVHMYVIEKKGRRDELVKMVQSQRKQSLVGEQPNKQHEQIITKINNENKYESKSELQHNNYNNIPQQEVNLPQQRSETIKIFIKLNFSLSFSYSIKNNNLFFKFSSVGFYEVGKTIGKGNYAVVKLAKHRITKTEVAIKIVDKRRLDANNLAKIYREIEVLKRLRHPHIVKLYQVMETNNMLYLVTEFASNGEIFDLISKQRRLTEENAREKFWQIISAVDYLHNINIVHRDLKICILEKKNYLLISYKKFKIKAENLLLDSNFQIKLADFGVILYVMVCGALPFEGVNLQLLKERVYIYVHSLRETFLSFGGILLSGRIRIPYFMSSDCENLIHRMLTVDSRKRPTIEQIKQHRWMLSNNFNFKYQNPPELTKSSVDKVTKQNSINEPHPQILRLMNNIGIETNKIKNSLLSDAYDNLHAIYLLLLERLQQRGSPSLSPNQSNNQTNISIIQQPIINTLITTQIESNEMKEKTVSEVTSETIIKNTNTPALVLDQQTSPIIDSFQRQQNIIRGAKARRQSDGVTIVGGGPLLCQCCCCISTLKQHSIPRGLVQNCVPLEVKTESPLIAHNSIPQSSTTPELKGLLDEQQQRIRHQQNQIAHASTSDYESENCCSSSSAAGSSLSRQSTIGTINSFDEGLIDEPNNSGLLMFANTSSIHNGTILTSNGGTQHSAFHNNIFCHEPLPAFDSQLSQDPLFSSQSSNNSAAAFLIGSCSSNGKTSEGDYCFKENDNINIIKFNYSINTQNCFPLKRGSKRKRDENVY
ncbi:Serine/threonine kinase [Meloidogyne graminicola]|uniref:non-specific serine/threonine protein kinase n=1 Tax=Meloidogyne graminicola TaxID=189291 RepID=A0A8S9ZGM3_9BILA|nr:Serine/threonine kinase [Meloidogyne graminicola]